MLGFRETSTELDCCSTFGVLDTLNISNNELTASGWVVSLEISAITELRLSVDGLSDATRLEDKLPSPDVSRAWPGISGSDNCRFALRTRLDERQMQRVLQHGIISITPYVGHVPGVPFERIWPISFPAAGTTESDQVGRGDFTETAFSFLSLFRLIARLRNDESILDAGCGIGRMAFGLAHYLHDQARYEGFDVSSEFVQMAQARYSSLQNFNFQHADIFNRMYNPGGKIRADRFAFPYEKESFSFVFLTSVFTHMLAADVQNYLREIRRVLSKAGRCFATFFSIDDEAESLMKNGESTLRLTHQLADGSFVERFESQEGAVGYRDADLHRMVSNAGLRVTQRHRGQWPGRKKFLTYQDVYVLEPI